VTELGSGGALQLPRARVVPLSAPPPSSCTAAVERYLTGAGIAKSSARIYRISLTTWGRMFAGEPPPTGPARRGAKPPVFPVAAIDDPALPEVLAETQMPISPGMCPLLRGRRGSDALEA
jgi:integrase/recombinase XerD